MLPESEWERVPRRDRFRSHLHGGFVRGQDPTQPLQVVIALSHGKTELPQLFFLFF